MDDDKKTGTIHLDREFLESSARQAAKDEENVQQHLRLVEWEYQRKKAFSLSPTETKFVITGLILVFLGVVSMLACLFGAPEVFVHIGKITTVVGVLFGALVGLRKSFKQISDLPPPPPIFKP